MEAPGGTTIAGTIGIFLSSETEGTLHKFCVVRNCFVDFGDATSLSSDYCAIAVGGGLGTIVEHNRFANAQFGLLLPNKLTTSDLIVRHNYFLRIPKTFEVDMTGTTGLGSLNRLVVLNNVVEWPTKTFVSPVAIHTIGQTVGNPPGTPTIKKLIIRDNVIRRVDNDPDGSEVGIKLEGAWEEAIIDNNVIDVGDAEKGVNHADAATAKIKPFNNLKNDGTLLRSKNTGTELHDPELTTDVEDLLLGL